MPRLNASYAVVAGLLALVACRPTLPEASGLSGSSTVDNGGDIITCASSASSPFEGIYTLDYVATYDAHIGTGDDPTGSYEELISRLQTLVDAKLPELSSSLASYLSLVENGDESQARVWHGSVLSPANLNDEDLRHITFTDNCKKTVGGASLPNLTQMVDRRYRIDTDVLKIHYYYDYNRFQQMKSELPLQAAYLVLHEWLWDFSDNAWISRQINRLLQSRATESMSSNDVHRILRSYGVTGDEAGNIGVPTGRTERLQEIFEANPACDFSHRSLIEFFPDTGREVFAAGAGKSYNLVVPASTTSTLGDNICGLAVTLGARGRGGQANLDLRIARGQGTYPTSVGAGANQTSEFLVSATCTETDCMHKQGELRDLLTRRGSVGSNWTLTITNNSSSAAEVLVPYLLLVKMREP